MINANISSNSVAIVTGASSGIGRALAVSLADVGIKVVGVARRVDKLKELEARNSNITTFASDLSTVEGREQFGKWIRDRKYDIRYLVHSIGTVQPIKRIDEIGLAEWRSSQATNLEAPLFTTLTLSDMISDGRILFVGSASSSKPRKGWSAYCCAKSGLFMAYLCLKQEWADRPVLISSAKPGPVETDIMEQGITADIDVFPDRVLFEDLRNKGLAATPDTVASFLRWLLLECRADDFAKYDWEISDTRHHQYWLRDGLYKSNIKS